VTPDRNDQTHDEDAEHAQNGVLALFYYNALVIAD